MKKNDDNVNILQTKRPVSNIDGDSGSIMLLRGLRIVFIRSEALFTSDTRKMDSLP